MVVCFFIFFIYTAHRVQFNQLLDVLSVGTDGNYMKHEIRLRIYSCVNGASLMIYMMNKLLFLVSSDTKTPNLVELPN